MVTGVVTKCLNSPKTKTKEKGFEIVMLYIELDKPDVVQVRKKNRFWILSYKQWEHAVLNFSSLDLDFWA